VKELKKLDEKDGIKAVAMDIGKNVSCYIEVMYPESVKASSSTFLLSVRNSIYNEIMHALTSDSNVEQSLARNRKFRKEIRELRIDVANRKQNS
jgi:hypothetical protein